MSMRDMSAELRLIESALGRHVFVVDGSRLYDLPEGSDLDEEALATLMDEYVPESRRRIDDVPLSPPPLLAVAQCRAGLQHELRLLLCRRGKFGGARG